MDRVIISGACGFIGKSTSLLFARSGIKTLAVDVFDRPPADFTAAGIEYCSCDIGDTDKLKSVIRQFGADTFLSLAWDGTEPSKRNDASLQKKNIQATIHSLTAAAACGCKRFVGVGSAKETEYEYALKTGLPLPDDCYGEAKFFSHSLCMRIAEIGRFVWKFTSIHGVSMRRTFVSRRMVKAGFRSTSFAYSRGPHTLNTRHDSDFPGPGLSITIYHARV